MGVETMDGAAWQQAIDAEIRIQQYICEQVYLSRKKDYDNIYRRATYRNEAEMEAAIGTIEDNSFVQQIRRETDVNLKRLEDLRLRL